MQPKVKRRPFGRTGLMVSEVGFGAMNLRRCETREQARATLDFVLDQGINLIDTARGYNGENAEGVLVESEVMVGQAIRERTDLTEPIVVITKGHGYTLEAFDEELATSLGKLGVTGGEELKIGENAVKLVYLFHGINEERWGQMKKSGVMEKAATMRSQGAFNYLGFSSHYAQKAEIKEALDTGLFDVCELPYNLFNRELGEDGDIDLLRYANERGVGIINMKAFSGNGFVDIYRILKDYMTIDYPTMLRFCLTNPNVSTVDAGAKYVEEFQTDIEASQRQPLTPAQLVGLKQEADLLAPHMKDICRECMHCLEKFSCPEGIDFPGILAAYSRFLIGTRTAHPTEAARQTYQAFEKNAEDCIECAECVPWCEYKLEIPKMLKEAHQALA